MTSSNAYESGDIVLVPFPFTDLKTTKKRPALILTKIVTESLPPLFIISMITSRTDAENIPGDCLMEQWKEAGLIQTSKVRLAKMVSIEISIILKKMGRLGKTDSKRVQTEFTKLFSKFISNSPPPKGS